MPSPRASLDRTTDRHTLFFPSFFFPSLDIRRLHTHTSACTHHMEASEKARSYPILSSPIVSFRGLYARPQRDLNGTGTHTHACHGRSVSQQTIFPTPSQTEKHDLFSYLHVARNPGCWAVTLTPSPLQWRPETRQDTHNSAAVCQQMSLQNRTLTRTIFSFSLFWLK